MKRIYTFTLENDDYPSVDFYDHLRLIAHMLYIEIYNYDGEIDNPLVLNDKVKYNKLNEPSIISRYRFDVDVSDCDSIRFKYEPFIISDNSFGFTIYNDIMSEDVIRVLYAYVLNILNLNYKVTINSICYESEDINDERNRKKAIRSMFSVLGYRHENRFGVLRLIRGKKNNRSRLNYEDN